MSRGRGMRTARSAVAVAIVGLAACFVVGSLMSLRREPVARAAAPSDPETRFLVTRSGRTHILDVGEGPVILLLHGSGRSIADWQEGLAERVTVVGHSVGGTVAAMISADHPGRVERAVFIGHGIAMDPMQWLSFVPGRGEIAMGRTTIFSDAFSKAHERRLAGAYAIRCTRAALLTYIRRQCTIDGIRLLLGT